MRIYNNNPAYGDCGPFEPDTSLALTFSEACEAFADAMQAQIREWAQEQFNRQCDEVGGILVGSEELAVDEIEAELRAEFIKGLTEIP